MLNVTTDGEGDVYLTSIPAGTIGNGSLVAVTTYNKNELGAPSYTVTTTPMAGGVNAATVQEQQTLYYYALTYDYNGNVLSAADSVNGPRSYAYDNLNRLIAYYGGLSPLNSPTLAQYSYDAYGNLTSGTGPASTGASVTWMTYNSKNQVTGDSIVPAGFTYDAGGNVQYDGVNTYQYDGAGRLCAVATSTGSVTQYVYDADGNRKARVSGGSIPAGRIPSCNQGIPANPTELFITDPAGHEVTELTVSNGWQWSRTDIYGPGGLIATGDVHGLHFHLSDWLGSRRVQVAGGTGQAAAVGSPELACSNSPWGTQLTCTGPGTDSTEHHFTSKERDSESGNDFFGARYYSSLSGRWMSPDSSSGSSTVPFAIFAEPQSLNLYLYMRNRPMYGSDPDGHCDWCQKLVNLIEGNGFNTDAQVKTTVTVTHIDLSSTDTGGDYGNSSVKFDPTGGMSVQAGASGAYVGGAISYTPGTGAIDITVSGGAVGPGASLTVSASAPAPGPSETLSGSVGIGGSITVSSGGETSTSVGIATPGASATADYTAQVGAISPLSVTETLPNIASPVGDPISPGLYMEDDSSGFMQ